MLGCALLAGLTVIVPPSYAQAAEPTNHLVISEVQTGGALTTDEFIELYNPTGDPVSLNGWSLQYRTNGTLIIHNFDPTHVVPAYGYFLARPSVSAPVAADTYYDAGVAGIDNLDDDFGTVYLMKTTAPVITGADPAIVDRLAYGAGSESPETGSAPAPATGESLERKPGQSFTEGNGIDTSSNITDFMIRTTPEPQLSTSAPEQPSLPTITDLLPAADSFLASQTVEISAKVFDVGSGIDPTALKLWIDRQPMTGFSYDPATQLVKLVLVLGQGTHTARLGATDLAGYSSERQWDFTVDTIAPSLTMAITDSAPTTSKLDTTVKLVAMDTPDGQASGVREMQIAFDGTLDNEPWEAFQSTVTRNLIDKDGLQTIAARVRDRAGNLSAIVMNTTTLTRPAPITTTTDTVIAAPISATSSTVGNTITITWPSVTNAVAYLIRYSDGKTLFGPIRTTDTFLVIGNVPSNEKLAFEVAAVSTTGSISGFTKVFPPELQPKVTLVQAPDGTTTVVTTQPAEQSTTNQTTEQATTEELPTGGPEESVAPAPTSTVSPSPSPSPEATPSVSPSPSGEVRGGETDEGPDWSRIIVALSILVIAAGVATGGWYLYQWWTTRPTDKGKGKGGRW